MAAHRYWRINILSNRTSYAGYDQLSEIVMAATAGGASLLGTGTASASSVSSGQPASYACDGDINTFWSSTAGQPQWWAYDFGASGAVSVAEARLTSRNSATSGDMDNAPALFNVEYSDDNSTWTVAWSCSASVWTQAQQQTFTQPAPATGPSHRYWRVNVTACVQGNFTSIAELSFAASAGGTNLATGGTASATTTYSTFVPANAFDGNPATYWDGGATMPAALAYDFGSSVTVAEVKISARNDGAQTGADQAPTAFDLQMSDDGLNWTTQQSYTASNWIAGRTRTFPKPASEHRYWRLKLNTTAGAAYGFTEVQFRTTAGTALLFSGGTASAGQTYGGVPGSYDASKAADNNTSTLYSSIDTSGTQYWAYDYGAGLTLAVVEVTITARNDGAHAQSPLTFDVQYSDDASTWTTLWSPTATTWTSGQTQTFTKPLPTTWNPSDSGSGILLTNGNLIASENGTTNSGNWRSIRATNARTTGKFYFEVQAKALTTGLIIGFMNASASLASYAGADANGFGWQPAYGAIYPSGSNGTTLAGAVCPVAVDIDARKVWFYNPSTGLWNGAALASQNPATGTGGLSISGMLTSTGQALYPAFSVTNSASQDLGIANFGATAFTYAAPSGFLTWDNTTPMTPVEGTPPTTWSPSDIGSGILLANGNLTASENGTTNSGNWRSVRGTVARSTGKLYFEVTLSALTTGLILGVSNAQANINSYVGSETNGYGWQPYNGLSYFAGGGGNIGASAAGQTVGVAVDFTAKKLWFYNPSTGLWNNASTATQNPATATGGLALPGVSLLPMLSVDNASSQDVGIANFGATVFANTMPTGFLTWDGTTGVSALPLRVTQAGTEVWGSSTVAVLRATQAGTEVWGSSTAAVLRATQAGTEVWLDLASAPPVVAVSAQPFAIIMA